MSHTGFVDACDLGFSPDANGSQNAKALQEAIDQGGTIVVTRPGTYDISATVYVGSDTNLVFGGAVYLKKVSDDGDFCHVILNKGALTRRYDHNITITGLNILVNGVDCRKWDVCGLHGHLSFFYAKDIRIERFRCLDLGLAQYCIHVCTFEDLIIDDVVIKGAKDGVHLGRGNRFTIRNGVFQTFDDAIALNAHDWWVGNPELGWIENGVVENCHDLNAEETTGYFCRILAGGWVDWYEGMDVQRCDTVISNGRMYRVQSDPDGSTYTSTTRPSHTDGTEIIDGIPWGMMQDEAIYTAGVRNVVFRDIFLHKPRTGFSMHLETNKWTRSYYPGADIPVQENFLLDNVRVLHDGKSPMLNLVSQLDAVMIRNSSFREKGIRVGIIDGLADYGKTIVNMIGCTFCHTGDMQLLRTVKASNRKILLHTQASSVISDDFSARIDDDSGTCIVESDLTGLNS